jgi:hypothetical protein
VLRLVSAVLLLTLWMTAPVAAQEPPTSSEAPAASAWRQHDTARPLPPRVDPASSRLPTPAPPDAVVLIPADGSSLDAWEHEDGGPAPWTVTDEAVVIAPGTGAIQTREAFGDLQLHLEWQPADEPHKTGQDRSNSGVFFLDGRYEVQILDTYDNQTYADGAAGAIYGQFPPLANALRPPGEWQAYDLFFRGPRFAADGTVQEPARLTVLLNGILIQNNEVLSGMTMWLESIPYEAHPPTGKILLQDHGSPVRFRNVWLRETPPRPAPPDGYGALDPVPLSGPEYDRLTGAYDRGGGDLFVIERTADGIGLSMPWRPGILRLLPRSSTVFQLAATAGEVAFTLNDDGAPTALTLTMGGGTYPATRTAVSR